MEALHSMLAASTIASRRYLLSAGQYVQWQDLFAIIDDGTIELGGYDRIEAAMKKQAESCPEGLACFVILPPGARPPPSEVQARIKTLLTNLELKLSCLCYVIEGTGFKAVAARAALVGMKVFAARSKPYPIYVETSMHNAISKVMSHLKKGAAVTKNVDTIVDALAKLRTGDERQPLSASTTGTQKPVGAK